MKEQFIEPIKWQKRKRELFNKIIPIAEKFQDQDYKITLRQLHYQLVGRNLIKNTKSEYTKLGTLIKEARLSGLLDWDLIVDNLRTPKKMGEWDSVKDIMESVYSSYRNKRHSIQKIHLEIWCEKDAMTSILEPITNKYHLNLMIDRGFGSTTMIYETAKRFLRESNQLTQEFVILYLGDHDPSGLNMVNDVQKRINMFLRISKDRFATRCNVKQIALTQEQCKKYNLPPQMAKTSDSRFKKYQKEYGDESWELDALPTDVISKILEDEILECINMEYYDGMIQEENKDKVKIKQLIEDNF